ncbi:MAG: hypothetical protein ACKO96_19485, partial [Flammeovirgaceae bacterium]
MAYIDIEQRSDEWHEERRGSLGGSEIFDATAKLKSGKSYTSKREDLLYKKLAERLGIKTNNYVNGAMRDGIAREPLAITAVEFALNISVKP